MKPAAKYSVEFFVILSSIMVSFLIEEWRQNSNEEDKEISILREIQADLEIDSAYISIISKTNKIAAKYALDLVNSNLDSLTNKFDAVLSYHNIKTRNIGYQKLSAGNNYNLIKSKKLFNMITVHYTQNYEMLNEWALLTRQIVLDRILPFLEKNGADEKLSSDKFLYGAKTFNKLKSNTQFRNLLKTSYFFKNSYHKVCEGVLKNNEYILAEIRTYLEQKKN
jgi:hypothetical protein